jgi:Predicted pyrophosphatase
VKSKKHKEVIYMTKEEQVIETIRKGPGMSPNEYQKLAMRTCSIPYEQKQDMLMHAVLGLASEAGEVAGFFQKKYQGHKVDPEHLEKELGDCLWMIAEACTALDWNMEDVMRLNIEKLQARYPNGFDAEHSIHRKIGDV